MSLISIFSPNLTTTHTTSLLHVMGTKTDNTEEIIKAAKTLQAT